MKLIAVIALLLLTILMAVLVVCGLDTRLGWGHIPVLAAAIGFLAAALLVNMAPK